MNTNNTKVTAVLDSPIPPSGGEIQFTASVVMKGKDGVEFQVDFSGLVPSPKDRSEVACFMERFDLSMRQFDERTRRRATGYLTQRFPADDARDEAEVCVPGAGGKVDPELIKLLGAPTRHRTEADGEDSRVDGDAQANEAKEAPECAAAVAAAAVVDKGESGEATGVVSQEEGPIPEVDSAAAAERDGLVAREEEPTEAEWLI